MVKCVGVDLVEVDRVRQALERYGERFLSRIYTAAERDYCRGRTPQLAARFAAKEATYKALDSRELGMGWHDVEVLDNEAGKPRLSLSGKARARAEQLGLTGLAVSLSHSRELAIAVVIGEAG